MPYKNKDIFGTAPVLKVHLMGMPYAVLPDGEIVKFRMDNTVLFLAYLVMNPKRIFHRSELASLFYPDHDDLHASQNIRQVIFRLRKVLKDEDRKVPALLVDSVTIRVNPVGPLRSDAHQFSERIIETLQFIRQHPHRRSEICRVCDEQAEEMIGYFTGEFLQGYLPRTRGSLDEWVPQVREEFRGRHIWFLHFTAKHHFEREHIDRCLAFLARITALDPMDEAAIQMNMRLLNNFGNRFQAFDLYQNFKTKLEASIGLQPGEDTTLLAHTIRSGEMPQSQSSDPFQTIMPIIWHEVDPDILPDTNLTFFGRTREIVEILELLESRNHSIIVLKGVAGAGKTRLALHVAELEKGVWADGIFFIPLDHSKRKQDELLSILVHAVGVSSKSSAASRIRLVEHLKNKEALIIIEDLDEYSEQAEIICSMVMLCPKIKFILTTRKHLGIRGEHVIHFGGLDYPSENAKIDLGEIKLDKFIHQYDALRLFEEAAIRVDPDFEINAENILASIRISQMVSGLPLGIELAASMVRGLSCDVICDRLYKALHGRDGLHELLGCGQAFFKKRLEYDWKSLNKKERELVMLVIEMDTGAGVETNQLLLSYQAEQKNLDNLQDKSILIKLPESRVKLHPLMRLYINR